MIIDYKHLYIHLASKYVFGNPTDKEKKMLDKLDEWQNNDDTEYIDDDLCDEIDE